MDPKPRAGSWGRVPEVHVLVCGNERPADNPKGSCARRGSLEVFDAFRHAVESRGLRGRVQVNRTNCLKPCGFGPTVVVYPQGHWYGGLTPADVEEVLDAALEQRAVERLLLPPDAMKAF